MEGSLASVLVHLVKRDHEATNMLDTSTRAQDAMSIVKERLHEMMRSEEDFDESSYSEVRMCCACLPSLVTVNLELCVLLVDVML